MDDAVFSPLDVPDNGVTTSTFVIPDVHGRHDLLAELLDAAAIPSSRNERSRLGIRVAQLGDLANCVTESVDDDLRCLELALTRLDVVLVGNHEYPYFGGPRFNGFHRDPEIATALARLERAGILQPCWRVADTLLTHAGVTTEWGLQTAADAEAAIRACWESERDTAPLLTQISYARRGVYRSTAETLGLPLYGGVLWSDWYEESRALFNQVHGHTPVRENMPEAGTLKVYRGHPDAGYGLVLNLDVGCGKGADGLRGLWLDSEGKPSMAVWAEERVGA